MIISELWKHENSNVTVSYLEPSALAFNGLIQLKHRCDHEHQLVFVAYKYIYIATHVNTLYYFIVYYNIIPPIQETTHAMDYSWTTLDGSYYWLSNIHFPENGGGGNCPRYTFQNIFQ